MKEFSHFYSRYGQALLKLSMDNDSGLTSKKAAEALLETGLNTFRLKAGTYEGKKQTTFSYARIKKGDPSNGVYLAPSVIISDLKATSLWGQIEALLKQVKSQDWSTPAAIKQSFTPVSGEYNNGRSRHTPKSTLEEAVCCAITTTTTLKPVISFREDGKYVNSCIIPELPLDQLVDFIDLYNVIVNKSTGDLLTGSVKVTEKKKANEYKPGRPRIYKGNFPNAPQSGYLAMVGVLAAIAEWRKEAKYTDWADRVLDSLKEATLYLVSYGDAKPFTYNHYVIDLAKDGDLKQVIDSIYYTEIIREGRRSYSPTSNVHEYKKLDFFASRFLQLFNRPAFKDFIAIRAEYPFPLNKLFTTYFTKMEQIPKEVVVSARFLGRWLNYVAYLSAKNESNNPASEEFRKAKAKVLVEMESSAFAAKNGDALIAQVITRAGRLSQMDAPPEATLFIEQTCSGELPLDKAKNLIMAFSRLRNAYEKSGEKEIVQESEDLN